VWNIHTRKRVFVSPKTIPMLHNNTILWGREERGDFLLQVRALTDRRGLNSEQARLSAVPKVGGWDKTQHLKAVKSNSVVFNVPHPHVRVVLVRRHAEKTHTCAVAIDLECRERMREKKTQRRKYVRKRTRQGVILLVKK
jgi:hypothetical protein